MKKTRWFSLTLIILLATACGSAKTPTISIPFLSAKPISVGDRKGRQNVGRDLGHQRYDKMVEALGGYGEYVENPDDIKAAIERAFASGKPALVNVCTDPDAQATTDMGFSGY